MRPPRADKLLRVALLSMATLLGVFLCDGAPAQQASSPAKPAQSTRDIPTPDQLEPGVNTTPAAPAAASPAADAPAPNSPAVRAPATQAPVPAPPPAGPARSAQAAPAGPPAAAPKDAAVAKNGARKAGGADRIELDTTDITGNRELPKVLYIVPWKRSDLGDLVGKPVNSLLDEVLQPLDRDVFQRENRYYDALKPGADGVKPGAVQGSDNKP